MYLCSFLLCLSFSLHTDYLVTIEIDNLYVKNIALLYAQIFFVICNQNLNKYHVQYITRFTSVYSLQV